MNNPAAIARLPANHTVIMVHLQRIAYPKLARVLASRTPQLVYLVLTEMALEGVGELPRAGLKHLRLLDLSRNRIGVRACQGLVALAVACPLLEHVFLNENPIAADEESLRRIKGNCYHLRTLNNIALSPDDHLSCIEQHGGKALKAKLESHLRFDLAMRQQGQVRAMPVWRPEAIVSLSLTGCGLSRVHVAGLPALRYLDLSGNRISDLRGCGLEHPVDLVSLSLADNAIHKRQALQPLEGMQAVARLTLQGNPLGDPAEAEEVMLYAVYACRLSRGTNQCRGLSELDGVRVPVGMRVAALERFGKDLAGPALERRRWVLHLGALIVEVRAQRPGADIRVLALPGTSLRNIDLREVPNAARSLTWLDLRDNDLAAVPGLEALPCLRVALLSGNRSLDHQACLQQLAEGSGGLLSLSVLPKPKASSRLAVIRACVPVMRYLEVVEGEPVTQEERCEAWRAAVADGDADGSDLETLAFRLAAAVAAIAENEGRVGEVATVDRLSYLPEDLRPGKQYDPTRVTELRGLASRGLTGPACSDLRLFKFLVVVNLSGNRITSLASLDLPLSVEHADLRNNAIEDPPERIAAFIDGLPGLQRLDVDGNPCRPRQEKPYRAFRSAVFAALQRSDDPEAWIVLDTPFTLEERCEAWLARGWDPARVEATRVRAALKAAAGGGKPLTVQALNLANCMLTHVPDLTPFAHLKKLDLSGNRIEDFTDLAELMNSGGIPELTELAVRDQDTSGGPRLSRMELLELLVFRVGDPWSPLRLIDGQQLTAEEALEANARHGRAVKDGKDVFRFHFELRGASRSSESIDLEARSLRVCPGLGSIFPLLTTLRLDRNPELPVACVVEALRGHAKLRALSIAGIQRGDHSQDFPLLGLLVDSLPRLEDLALALSSGGQAGGRVGLLSCIKRAAHTPDPAFALVLNGRAVDAEERVSAREHAQPGEGEAFRLELACAELGVRAGDTEVRLQGHGLRSVGESIRHLSMVTVLDLSLNRIRAIEPGALHGLACLTDLNLSENLLPAVDAVIAAVRRCPELTSLRILHCTENRKLTADPERYGPEVCRELRGIKHVDGVASSFTLAEEEVPHFEVLRAMTGACRNELMCLDVSKRGLAAGQFGDFVAALVSLRFAPHSLDISDNPWGTINHIRLVVIHALESGLRVLDGREVTDSEKANARTFVIKTHNAAAKRSRKDSKLGVMDRVNVATGDAALGVAALVARRLSTASVGGDGGGGGEAGNEAGGRGEGAGAGSDSAPSALQSFSAATDDGTVGSPATKLELVIGFLQMLSLLMDITEFKWPVFLRWTYALNFDINWLNLDALRISSPQYVRFGLLMALPPLLSLMYVVRTDAASWEKAYWKAFSWTRVRMVILVLLTLLAAVGVGYFVQPAQDRAALRSGRNLKPSATMVTVVGGVAVLLLLFLLGWTFIVVSYRRAHRRIGPAGAFELVNRIRQRACLFFLTILYLPIARSVLQMWQCEAGTYTNFRKDAETRPDAYTCYRWLPVHYAAVLFGALYIFGIPAVFSVLIRDGVKVVIANTNLPVEQGRLAKLKAKLKAEKAKPRAQRNPETKEGLKAMIKTLKDSIRLQYAVEVKNFVVPASYLYRAFEEDSKYNKVRQMAEKIVVLVVTLFAFAAARTILRVALTAAVLAFTFAVDVILRPFSDQWEDRANISAKFTLAATAALATVSVRWDPKDSRYVTIAMAVLHALNALFVLFCIIFGPIQNGWAARKVKSKRARVLGDDDGSDDAEDDRGATEEGREMADMARAEMADGGVSTADVVTLALPHVGEVMRSRKQNKARGELAREQDENYWRKIEELDNEDPLGAGGNDGDDDAVGGGDFFADIKAQADTFDPFLEGDQ